MKQINHKRNPESVREVWIGFCICRVPLQCIAAFHGGSQESQKDPPPPPRIPKRKPESARVGWIGLGHWQQWGGIAAFPRLGPHGSSHQPWEAMGRRLMDQARSGSVSAGSSFEEDEVSPRSHLLGRRHHRPWVGCHVQQVGRRNPWQRRIQVKEKKSER